MSRKQFDLNKVMENLQKRRKYFSSEADFQLALAMQIEKEYGENSVICEFVPDYKSEVEGRPSRIHIDILYCGENIPIELKYRTKKAELCENDRYKILLSNQDAHDEGGYGFWRDVCRVGEYIKKEKTSKGYAVFLTNDVWYKEPDHSRCRVDYKDFNLNTENISERSGIVSNKERLLKNIPPITADWYVWDEKAEFYYFIAEV